MFCTVSLLVYSSVALDASIRVGSSYLCVVYLLILAVPLLVRPHPPCVAFPSVVHSLLFLLWSGTLPSARSQWALPTPSPGPAREDGLHERFESAEAARHRAERVERGVLAG